VKSSLGSVPYYRLATPLIASVRPVGPRIIVAAAGTARPTRYALRLRNLAVFSYANEFCDAAKKAGSPLVRAYLLGHALELYLKAFLLKSGFNSGDLKNKRKFGHQLDRLLTAAEAQGIGKQVHISARLRQDMSELNSVYSSRALQYFSLAHMFTNPTIPHLARIFRFADQLRKTVGKLVQEKA